MVFPIASCLLPLAFCLLPFAPCLWHILPIAHCLLPIASYLSRDVEPRVFDIFCTECCKRTILIMFLWRISAWIRPRIASLLQTSKQTNEFVPKCKQNCACRRCCCRGAQARSKRVPGGGDKLGWGRIQIWDKAPTEAYKIKPQHVTQK